MARPEFDIVVIGGGSGGLVAAAGGAALGAKVALIEKNKLGGDCLWYGCVPSKTLIKSARVAHKMRHADRWALTPNDPRPSLVRVMERVAAVQRSIEPNDSPERFRGLGVEVIFGSGRFIAPDAVEVGGRKLTATHFVIATGSRPAVAPIPGIDSIRYLTNETIFDLREPVPHLIVVGSGPIGSEMAQAFRRLGSEVTVVDIAPSILAREDPELAAVVFRQLQSEGVHYHLGASIMQLQRTPIGVRILLRQPDGAPRAIDASHLLLATGRRANIEDLGLDKAGIDVVQGRIVLEDGLVTTNPRVYVAGDVAGGHQFTHVAEHHAGIVLRHVIFKLKWAKPSTVVPWCTYTDPEFARVGLSESEAKKTGVAHRVYTFPFADIDRARAEGETEGLAKLVTDPKGRLLGAAIVGPHAGELIAECVLAIGHRMKAGDLSAAIHTYPTLAQINRRAADQRLKESLTPTSKAWIKRIFRLQGA
jgi:pyruvate/2-oxoglutarate dehydrogenase complex dihydrolipoamide dehydrogenase (E3) component